MPTKEFNIAVFESTMKAIDSSPSIKKDIDNAIANLDKVNNKVDYVITHCCDTHTVIKTFGFRRDVCTDQLTFVDKVVDYKHWFFGHYHYDRKINDKKTCLYQDIIEIK